MSAKPIYEADGKRILVDYIGKKVPEALRLSTSLSHRAAVVDQHSSFQDVVDSNPWLLTEVSKPVCVTFV